MDLSTGETSGHTPGHHRQFARTDRHRSDLRSRGAGPAGEDITPQLMLEVIEEQAAQAWTT